jgi:talin
LFRLTFTTDALPYFLQFPSTGRGFQEVQMNLNSRAADLNQATSDIVTAASQDDAHRRVAPASDRFGSAYEEFIDGGLEMAGVTKDPNTQTQIVTGLRSVSMVSSRFLMATKSLLVDPNAPNAKNQLTQAAR